MAELIVTENITLDGVVSVPMEEDGSKDDWFETSMRDDRAAWAEVEVAEAIEATALLLGRRTDEYFGRRWNNRTGVWAERLNALPKFVVSSTIDEATWQNSTVLSDDVADEVAELKRNLDGVIVTYGSRQLMQALLKNDLVDEVRLLVFPVIQGSGERLFDAIGSATALRLDSVRQVGEGIARLTYRVERAQ
ncbi:deaminase [Planctomonas sp. JC2975]|uniref:dihydrofolate reductase family protein n=1 Tax=Planctomonas sp. JC2975 TaxID=2729626 RepID=UPI001476236A|nr:dihydrofolate reductase family protein [Planctomonas sp. JC2975]NNC10475.1 deaminase [Planctomonas sp. JC2975]